MRGFANWAPEMVNLLTYDDEASSPLPLLWLRPWQSDYTQSWQIVFDFQF